MDRWDLLGWHLPLFLRLSVFLQVINANGALIQPYVHHHDREHDHDGDDDAYDS